MMAEVTTTILTMSKILMTKEATRCQEVVIGVATTASAGHAPSTTKKMIDEDQLGCSRMCMGRQRRPLEWIKKTRK